nr:MAG TPA: hypothetical protein [Caudoviricetes sp.]
MISAMCCCVNLRYMRAARSLFPNISTSNLYVKSD